MNTQELKEKVLGAIGEAGKFSVLSIVSEIFDEYEKSNKSEESQINENKQVLTNDFLLELIKGMKTEIESLKKQVEAIDKVKVIDSDLKQKQERFYYNPCDYYGKTMYEIIDRNKIININSLLNYEEIAIDICKALNSLEASK